MSGNTLEQMYFVIPDGPHLEASEQSGLLLQLVETCGYASVCVDAVNLLPNELNSTQLILVDFHMASNVADLLSVCTRPGRWVFYNVPRQGVNEMTFLMAGAEGIFYAEDKPELLLKGIHRLNKLEAWFKRDTVNRAFRQLREKNSPHSAQQTAQAQQIVENAGLTKREKNILILVSKGAQNQEIADSLHISVNTVKTHIYSIFRKTNSRNRVELVTWANNVLND